MHSLGVGKVPWRCPNLICRVVIVVEPDERIAADRASI
jgi:hypothetical protein